MAETTPPTPAVCPWCSAALPDPGAAACPTCGASLTGPADSQVPGVTAVDIQAIALRRTTPPKKNRLLSWISGDVDYEGAPEPDAPSAALEPPPIEVRREMLRMEMAAKIADLTAEAGSFAADEAVAAGESGDLTTARADIQAAVDADAVADEMGAGDAPELASDAAGTPPVEGATESGSAAPAADVPTDPAGGPGGAATA